MKQTVHRGRPRKLDPEKGLEIATRLFHEKGYDSVGVAELTDEMGIKAPSFYAAYGSKRELLYRILERYSCNEGDFARPILDEDLPPKKFLEQLFQAAAEAYCGKDQPRGCLLMECTRNSVDQQAVHEVDRFREAFQKAIRRKIATYLPNAADALGTYAMTILAGLSASARNGVSRKKLLETARIAARGIT